jgi:hypothetical protein
VRDAQTAVSQTEAPAYIRPVVRLEMGAPGDFWPSEDRAIVSYAAETIAGPFRDPHCPVKVLAAERSFWQNITILHACYHRTADKPLKERQSRHCYDVARL